VKRVIGIDLGTTNSCVALFDHGAPSVISNIEGARTTPSVVGLSGEEPIVGVSARRQAVLSPETTVSSIKRFMGRSISEVDAEIKTISYKVEASKSGAARVRIGEELYSPEQISSIILIKLKADAEAYLGQEVEAAVITVPAYFNDAQRTATKQAAEIAGLEVLRLVNEPTAAALAYGFDDKQGDQRLLVFDMGGGTLDVSVLETGESVFEVIATKGDNHLGGDDFDQAIVDWLVQEFKRENGTDLTQNPEAMQRLLEAAEKAKIELSTVPKTDISLPFIGGQEQAVHLSVELTRSKLNELSKPLLDRITVPLESAMADCLEHSGPVDQVIIVGGMTRMPAIIERVARLTRKEVRPGVNPDEAVALGAAIQAGVLLGQVEDVLLLDVTPLSLGIETKNNVMTRLIEANTTVPVRATKTFTTAEANQLSVAVNVFQGERPLAKDNRSLGRLKLYGIPPAQPGIPQIEVVFDLDADGILNVSALDLGTGEYQATKIESATGLSDEEVLALKKEAEEHKSRDAADLENAEQATVAEVAAEIAQRELFTNSDKMDPDELERIEQGLDELQSLLAAEPRNPQQIKKVAGRLMISVQTFSNRIFGSAPTLSGEDGPTLSDIIFSPESYSTGGEELGPDDAALSP